MSKDAVTLTLILERPSLETLASYVAALEAGWSPDKVRGRVAADEHLAQVAANPADFIAGRDDPEGLGPPMRGRDGSLIPRLPGFTRWIWDGDFCGAIGFRWRAGTAELPPHVLGHIGYAVVPWKQGRGYATRALALMLVEAWDLGLPHVDLTTNPANLASQKVITANGGALLGPFVKPASMGGGEGLRFRIPRPT